MNAYVNVCSITDHVIDPGKVREGMFGYLRSELLWSDGREVRKVTNNSYFKKKGTILETTMEKES